MLHQIISQVGQVILNLPNSMAKCGMGLGTFFQVMCATAAVYTLWLLSSLYQEFKRTAVSVQSGVISHKVKPGET